MVESANGRRAHAEVSRAIERMTADLSVTRHRVSSLAWDAASEVATDDDRARWLLDLNRLRREYGQVLAEMAARAAGDGSPIRNYCPECRVPFTTGRLDRKYCTDTCKQRAYRRRRAYPGRI